MLEQLFGSRTRVKLLRLFLNHPDKSYYVRELTRELKSQINAIRRELQNLESLGIIIIKKTKEIKKKGKRSKQKQKKYYTVNQDFILYSELKALLLKAQLLIEENLVKRIKELGRVYYLVLTGTFVGLKDGTTDILIVGKLDKKRLRKLVKKFEKELGREINYTVLGVREFAYRMDITDKFLYSILENKKIIVIDEISK
jgi:predicted transcriptional regulator